MHHLHPVQSGDDSGIMDVLIVGAGLSGIGAARHLQMHCPQTRWCILEAREAIGGTWDLFKYPGIRSDSDMYTLGYTFHPWRNPKAIADGPSILNYIQEGKYSVGEKFYTVSNGVFFNGSLLVNY